ncbi:MAG: holo-ACP synthase [Candidatus Auribacterota bacterium]|nr:holo-ACP synthase [Candidatus Auribacterota bacterium]
MILGIGIDIIEIQRVEKLLEKRGDSFLKRVFLPGEIEYCREKSYPAQHYAARLAVKEAVMKGFGEGWTEKIGWKDILVTRTSKGQPGVELLGKGKKLEKEKGVEKILISLSHADNYSVAQAIIISSV